MKSGKFASAIEKYNIPVACVTALHTVALQVGTNRILIGGKFHHVFGRPELPHESEFAWRKKTLQAALTLLTKEVDEPTVFTVDEVLS